MTRKQLVADLVTQVVVDDLEAIDVAEQDRHALARALGLQQRVVEVVEQEPPVGQAGEGVLERVARASCSSNALRSEMSRKTMTAPEGADPPTTGDAVMVTGKCEPSRRSKRAVVAR